MSIPMPGAASTTQPVEVRELQGEEAEQALVTDFGELTLVPIEQDAWRTKLQRAGLSDNAPSERSALRAEVTP